MQHYENRECDECGKSFKPVSKRSRFCIRKCSATYHNRIWNPRKPRTSSKRYGLAKEMKAKAIPEDQMEIIYGCLLGDSGLVLQTDGFHKLSTTHCVKQLDWLQYKVDHLRSIFSKDKPVINHVDEKTWKGQIFHARDQATIHSISHPGLTNIRHHFYRGNRPYISPKILNRLTSTSLLVWYIDDGSYNRKGKNAVLFTNAYDLGVVRCIRTWFWHRHRIKSGIYMQKQNGKEYPVLRITVAGTETLFSVLRNSSLYDDLPDCIRYKLGL